MAEELSGPTLIEIADEMTSVSSSQLSIIVDLASYTFDFKKLCNELQCLKPPNFDHHYWHFGGLRSYTIPFESDNDEDIIDDYISKLKLLQDASSRYPPFWISHKKCEPQQPNLLSLMTSEVIRKNVKIGRFFTNNIFKLEYTAGALVQIDLYKFDMETAINDGYCLVFYHDKIDIEYGNKNKRLRKSLKAQMIDKCVVTMTEEKKRTYFINMTGNLIDYECVNDEDMLKFEVDSSSQKSSETTNSYRRTALPEPQSFYSTVRLVISLQNENASEADLEENLKRLHYCDTQFQEFFQRNRINNCWGSIHSKPSSMDSSSMISSFMDQSAMPFVKQYCWHMLLSIGYRFQLRLNNTFVEQLNAIEGEDEFYQTSLHIWRRSSEYYFINLCTELRRYREKLLTLASLSTSSRHQHRMKKDEVEQERWSIYKPPRHYAYVPSVTLTPTTISVKPFKLVKTNRVLREQKFGGHLMFALVDVKDENGTLDLFPNDYRSLRWKIESLLDSGFDLGRRGRTYRYLHHSQSQLKDKQFWFYHHDPVVNLSFEEAFDWMGDFQDEKIVAKHSARIAQCFTSAEATIQIPSEQVEYIPDIHSDDRKYNFTDGVGTMSTFIRDNINPHRQFSAVQIRYGGCKGVISVNPDLDGAPQQLRIRQSMKKFKSSHDTLELCRISKPRPLYLNRQIITLLSHRLIDDRTFLLLQNDHQKHLSESLVYPPRAYELLSDKLSRNLFPLRALINDAQLNLIQEPFFRQLIITIGKYELAQMRERTRLKLPKNSARNMIGIVDEYGVLEYGQVFIQYTELNDDCLNNNEPERTVVLQQKVVVTKNPCHHPGDIRVFSAVDVPRLRHLKDVIVFPQRGKRPHPNEISGSDLDGDEYAVIWHPSFVPQTENNQPYDYDSQIPLLRVCDRPINRADIQATVLDISEQSCVGKLCSLHLATMDRYGVSHPKTLAIAGYIAEELDAPKTGHHPLTPKQIAELQSELGNERPDYFDKPYYKPYPSKHILGQLFRSCLRFEPNWITVQTPPTTVLPAPIDPLLVHDSYNEFLQSAQEIARVFREQIMDIMYVYRFSSDIDLLCRYDSLSSQYKTPLTKQQTESSCLIADSAQVEFKQLMHRVRRLFFEDVRSCDKSSQRRCHPNCPQCTERKMAKASALYVYCYTDVSHARRILSLPWLFAPLLIDTRKANIRKQAKLLSPVLVEKMLEIQPYHLIGQSLQDAVQHLIDTKKSSYFYHAYSSNTPTQITVSLRPKSTVKRLLLKLDIPLVDYLIIEVLHHYVIDSLSKTASLITELKPALVDSVWQHIITRFVLKECSPLVLQPATATDTSVLSSITDFKFWSDEQAYVALQNFIKISVQCTDHGPQPTNYAHAHEYLVSALQKMATNGFLFSP